MRILTICSDGEYPDINQQSQFSGYVEMDDELFLTQLAQDLILYVETVKKKLDKFKK